MVRSICFFISILIMNSCTLFQPKERPALPIKMPDEYTLNITDGSKKIKWWENFNSQELNLLIEKALAGNFDIKSAWHRLRQAEAILNQTRANRIPTVGYNTNAQKQWSQTRTTGDSERIHSDSENWSLGLSAAFEIDLWGKLKSKRQAESFAYQATREDLETAAVTVTATIVETWLDIMATRQKIKTLKDQIKTNTTLLELQKLRFTNGKAQALAVSQQREALASVRAELPLHLFSERQLLNSLALLIGKTTPAGLNITQAELPQIIPLPASGIPADLIASRPDVRASGLRLKSADWDVSASRADRLPTITLSAQSDFTSGKLDLLFDNWVNTLSAGITGPLIDGGKRAAEVRRTQALADEYLTNYIKTVATALKEVEDSLARESMQQEYMKRLAEQLEAARSTAKAARLQYINGQSSYLSYLTAWLSIQNLEIKIVNETANLIKNRVTLHRVLGGNQTSQYIFPAQSKLSSADVMEKI